MVNKVNPVCFIGLGVRPDKKKKAGPDALCLFHREEDGVAGAAALGDGEQPMPPLADRDPLVLGMTAEVAAIEIPLERTWGRGQPHPNLILASFN